MNATSSSVESILNKQDVNYHLEKLTPLQEFFIMGHTHISLEDFENSDLNEYLEMYWGEMVYQTCPSINFIKVYRYQGRTILSDAILIDQFKHLIPIGSIVPKVLSAQTRVDHTGARENRFLEDLFYKGYAVKKIKLDTKRIVEGNYDIQCDLHCPDYLQGRHASNDFLNGSPCPDNDDISGTLWREARRRYSYNASRILKTSVDRILRCNRTRKGHQLEPHSDCNQSSYLAAIHYTVPKGTVLGREFEIAIQDPIDEYNRIRTTMTHSQQLHVKKRYDIKPLVRIPVEDKTCVFINNYNPKFVHGHPHQLSDEPVYSMVTQLAHPQVPENNKLNIMKNLSGMV